MPGPNICLQLSDFLQLLLLSIPPIAASTGNMDEGDTRNRRDIRNRRSRLPRSSQRNTLGGISLFFKSRNKLT
jgi:hypothetical protein